MACALAGAAALPAGASAVSPSTACSSWSSLTEPPPSIRVLRRKSGRIETVPFRQYVITVMGREWPSYLPQAVVEAGAIVAKQYAWYHAVHTSRSSNGRCFDVRDGVTDQLYKPGLARISPELEQAVDLTWGVTLRREGEFFMTGYRRGEKVPCGHDATGYKLFARSAVDCARSGLGWREILARYYGPDLGFVGDGLVGDGQVAGSAGLPPPPETGIAPAPAAAWTPGVVALGAPVGGGTTGGLESEIAGHDRLLMRMVSRPVV